MNFNFKINVMMKIFGWKNGNGPCRLTKIIPKNETKIAIDLQDKLTEFFLDGRMKCIWAHIPNEGHFSKNKNFATMFILRRMGKAKGFPDYVFIKDDKSAVIELKREKNANVGESQKIFEEWTSYLNIPYLRTSSVNECVEFLTKHGFIEELSTKGVDKIVNIT